MRILPIVALLSVPPLAASFGGDAKDDVKQMQGTWRPLAAEFAGDPFPDQILKTIKLILKDDRYTALVGEKSDEGTYSVDPDKSPKTMDVKGTKGPNEGKTFLTIYELKGDQLRICYDLSGKARPTEFATKKETMLYLVTYRREQP